MKPISDFNRVLHISKKAEGQGDQLAGAAFRKKGSLKDRLKAWIDRF